MAKKKYKYYMYEMQYETLYGVKETKADCIRTLNEEFPTPSSTRDPVMPFEIQIVKKEVKK